MRMFRLVVFAFVAWMAGTAVALEPPTQPGYSDEARYRILDVQAQVEGGVLEGWSVTMGALEQGSQTGLQAAVLELYYVLPSGGRAETLAGSGLRFAGSFGWVLAVRISAEGAWLFVRNQAGLFDPPRALDVVVVGDTLWVPVGEQVAAGGVNVAVSGVYDPFAADGWRRFSRAPSPWAFSGDPTMFPVVDVFPHRADVLSIARAQGEWRVTSGGLGGSPAVGLAWFWVLAGVLFSVSGLWIRYRVPRAPSLPPLIGDEDVTLTLTADQTPARTGGINSPS